MPDGTGTRPKNSSSGVRPPAEAPMPTTMISAPPGIARETSGGAFDFRAMTRESDQSGAHAARLTSVCARVVVIVRDPEPSLAPEAWANGWPLRPGWSGLADGRRNCVDRVGDHGVDPERVQLGDARGVVDRPRNDAQPGIARSLDRVGGEQRVLHVERDATQVGGERQ